MSGQRIELKYLDKLKDFFIEHSLEDFQVIYDNEKYFKDFLDAQTFKFTNSGTSALFLIMKRLKRYGCQTIWGPAFTHVSWINCAEWLEMDYDFVDVNPSTLSLDPYELQAKIDKGECPDVVIMVDIGGYVGEDTLLVKKICERYQIELIEDAAHAFGQSYNGVRAGMYGDFSFYSFSNPKLLTCGEGGAIVSSKHDLDDIMEEQIYQGGWYKYDKQRRTQGLNFIMSNMNTQLLRWQLEDLEEIQKEWKSKYNVYLQKTPDLFHFNSDNEHYAPSFFARRLNVIPQMVKDNKMPSLMHARYRNMGGSEYKISETLENQLVYWKL